MAAEHVAKIANLSLDEKTLKDTVKNAKLTATLAGVVDELKLSAPVSKTVGALILMVVTKVSLPAHRSLLAGMAADGRLASSSQISAGIDFLKKVSPSSSVDQAALEAACGVGVVVSREQIAEVVAAELRAQADWVAVSRYFTNPGPYLGAVKSAHKWADGALSRTVFDEQLAIFCGPKTAEDLAPDAEKAVQVALAKKRAATASAAAAASPSPQADASSSSSSAAATASAAAVSKREAEAKRKEEHSTLPEAVMMHLAPPSANTQATPELLEAHLKATGGMVYTRFPPEPNGYLHIGHAKSQNLNFNYAKRTGGRCYLRFDDTNPTAEKHEYIDSIISTVKWLGHTPWKITYSSDKFPQLYNHACELIRRRGAYVCHCSKAEMKCQRDNTIECAHRDRPVEENLKLFADMRKGLFDEGEAVLRLRSGMKNPNTSMRDLVAYRIKYAPHPRTGNEWCIYPAYDFTHCLCDSMENITHSLCTLEFNDRREVYNWILDTLGLYRPPQIEFSRLNLTYQMMSKRNLLKLVQSKRVRGWDDPRMPTIEGIRRRGFTPFAINDLCERVGVTRSANLIPFDLLELCVRNDLDANAPRAMAVLDPLPVTLTGLSDDVKLPHSIAVPNHPTNEAMGTHAIEIGAEIFIERSDFRLVDDKSFFGLAPGKTVSLKHTGWHIRCESVERDAAGAVARLVCAVNRAPTEKVKGHLHWVSAHVARRAEVRLYKHLFTVPEPTSHDNWQDYIDPSSEIVMPSAVVDGGVPSDVAPERHFQFERLGYFVTDRKDCRPDALVFNRTVSLKDERVSKATEKAPGAIKNKTKAK